MSKIISVYFNGTDDENDVPLHGYITLATLLDQMTVKDDNKNISICVNGCGVESKDIRDLGMIFTFHLEQQVIKIAKKVERMINDSNEKIILNIYGFSRGGAAAFLLCQKLKSISSERLTINVASFEPVPGNFISGAYSDVLLGINTTLSAAVADLTECSNIANMLILFTNQPLPDIACHAPILPVLPPDCKSEVDVTPGCHKGSVSYYKLVNEIQATNDESAIVFHRIVEFMQKCGTSFNFNKFKLNNDLIDSDDKKKVLKMYDNLAQKMSFGNDVRDRPMHFLNTIFTAKNIKKYLNRYHQQLCHVDVNDQDCALTVQNRKPQRIDPSQRKVILLMEAAIFLASVWMIRNKYFNESSANNSFRMKF